MTGLSNETLNALSSATLLIGVTSALIAAAATVIGTMAADERDRRSDIRVSENERIAAEARLETERLKAVVAWRVLEPGGKQAIQTTVAKHPGQPFVMGVADGPESRRLMYRIEDILTAGGWKRGSVLSEDTQTADGVAGIYELEGMAVATAPEAAASVVAAGKDLADALTAAGLPTRFDQHQQFSPHPERLMVMVGYKAVKD